MPVATVATGYGKRGWMLLIPKGSDAEVPPPRVFWQKSPQSIENKGPGARKRAQRDDKRRQTAENMGFATPTRSGQATAQRHRVENRKEGRSGTPVATGSMRNWLRSEGIESLRGPWDRGGPTRELAPPPY